MTRYFRRSCDSPHARSLSVLSLSSPPPSHTRSHNRGIAHRSKYTPTTPTAPTATVTTLSRSSSQSERPVCPTRQLRWIFFTHDSGFAELEELCGRTMRSMHDVHRIALSHYDKHATDPRRGSQNPPAFRVRD